MPNTLAHIGIQTPLTRLGRKKAPLQWIAVGCIIPDMPWIVQRLFTFIPGIDPLSLRLYAVTQASLLYCLLLSLALAMLTRNSKQIFLILATNSLLHLLLDASQTKWGNGVNLLVPFSWHTTNFGLFWPEHFSKYIFIFLGIIAFALLWPKAIHEDLMLQKPNRAKVLCATACLLVYLASPIPLTSFAYNADTHYCKTLTNNNTRVGKQIEIDRARYSAATNSLGCYIDTNLKAHTLPVSESGLISIRGRFIDKQTIEVQEHHIHHPLRDYASYAGLLLTLLLWTHSLLLQKPFTTTSHRNTP